MKKKAPIVFIIVSVFAVAAIIIISAYRSSESYRKAKATIQWDCSVSCTEKSTSAQYVITYSNVKVSSKTGTLTIQNRNDFEIVVHLLCEGEQEIVSGNIPAGSCYSFANVTDKEYTVGIHADVDAATNIKVIVYDGKDTEPSRPCPAHGQWSDPVLGKLDSIPDHRIPAVQVPFCGPADDLRPAPRCHRLRRL